MATVIKAAPLEIVGEGTDAKLVLADSRLMEEIANLSASAVTVTITDAASADAAGTHLRKIAALDKQIEETRISIKEPFLAKCRQIDSLAKQPRQTLLLAGDNLRRKLGAWQQECDRRAEEAERQRQAEIARLAEQERLAKEKEEKAAAAAAAASSTASDDDLGEFDVMAAGDDQAAAAVERQRIADKTAQLQQTRAVIAPAAPAGISYRTQLIFSVLDVQKLPTALVTVTANEAAIRSQYCVGWKEGDPVPSIAGLKFSIEKKTIVSGRR